MDGTEEWATQSVWEIIDHWWFLIDEYGFRFGKSCVSFLQAVYRSLTLLNVSVFFLKYVPTGIYMFKLVKNIYVTSRERIKVKQLELEDIQLQIQIVNTKMCVRDAEYNERTELLRQSAERLRALRARVRDLIAADESLRRTIDRNVPWADDTLLQTHTSPEEEREFIIALLKELKADHVIIPEPTEKKDCGDPQPAEFHSADDSTYSSISDSDSKDCRVKIVKVTNVYKVAYLKHYIKQKRLRRATKQALLKKKIESIKKLLEEWQRSLNMVINTKLSMFDANPADVTLQEAMGDYSKPNLRDSSDSDSDLRPGTADPFYDEYSLSWAQNPYRSYPCQYDDIQETTEAKDLYDSQDFSDVKYQPQTNHVCECKGSKANVLFILPEETSSQLAIDDLKSDSCNGAGIEFESDCRDFIAL